MTGDGTDTGPPAALRPVLHRHAALKSRAQGDVLVLPERAIRLGGSGGEIVRLCDGGHSLDDIVQRLAERYPDTPPVELRREVRTFVGEMLEIGGLTAGDDRREGRA